MKPFSIDGNFTQYLKKRAHDPNDTELFDAYFVTSAEYNAYLAKADDKEEVS